MKTIKPMYTYLGSVLRMQCPRCREGKVFKNKLSIGINKNLSMHQNCPICGQPTEIEVGFYFGTGYVSYALAVAFTASTFVAWLVLIGISIDNNSIYYWLVTNAVLLIILQPWLMRFSRVLWLSWFVPYNPNWHNEKNEANERAIHNQMEGHQSISDEELKPKDDKKI